MNKNSSILNLKSLTGRVKYKKPIYYKNDYLRDLLKNKSDDSEPESSEYDK